jgi:hypothetical protein
MHFLSFDRNNCRVYYRGEKGGLYCLQDETDRLGPQFRFYRCTAEGEPSYPVPNPFAFAHREYADRKVTA